MIGPVLTSTVLISSVLIGCTVPPHVTRFLGVSMADLTRQDNLFGITSRPLMPHRAYARDGHAGTITVATARDRPFRWRSPRRGGTIGS